MSGVSDCASCSLINVSKLSHYCLSHPYQLVFFAAGLGFLFGQFTHLLFDVADLPLQTFVLLLLSVLAAAALVSFFRQLL